MDSDKTTTANTSREAALQIVRDSLCNVKANPTNNQIALASLHAAFTAVEQYVSSHASSNATEEPETGDLETDESEEESEEVSESGSEEEPDDEEEELPADVQAKIAESVADAAKLSERKTEIETKIADLEQQLVAVRAAYPDFYPVVSEKDYESRKRAYTDADTAYKSALRKLNDELMSIRKDIDAKKAEIGNKLTIRGKPLPTTDDEWCTQYQVIRDLVAVGNQIKNRHKIPPPPSQKDIEFFGKYPYYSTFTRVAALEFDPKSAPIKKQLRVLLAELKPIQQALEEETWRPKYLAYAFKHNLVCDDENIFRVCNGHHMEELLFDWHFDCPCDTDYYGCYSEPDESVHGHSFCDGEGRCTRGTKMYVDWDVDDLDLGFIEGDYPVGADVMFK